MTYADRYCRTQFVRKTEELKSAGTPIRPATAAPAHQIPIPSAGAAHLSVEEEFNITGGLVF